MSSARLTGWRLRLVSLVLGLPLLGRVLCRWLSRHVVDERLTGLGERPAPMYMPPTWVR